MPRRADRGLGEGIRRARSLVAVIRTPHRDGLTQHRSTTPPGTGRQLGLDQPTEAAPVRSGCERGEMWSSDGAVLEGGPGASGPQTASTGG